MSLLLTKYTPNEVQTILETANLKKSDSKSAGTRGKLFEVCKYVKFFRGIDYDDVMAITEGIEFRRYKKGEIVVKEGAFDKDIFYIIKGEAGVFKKVDAVRRKHIASIHEGQIFGEMATLMDTPRSATIAVTSEGTTILSFKMNTANLNKQYGEAFSLFFKNMARDLAFKLDDTNKRLFAGG